MKNLTILLASFLVFLCSCDNKRQNETHNSQSNLKLSPKWEAHTISPQNEIKSDFTTRNTNLYSIDYPKQWKIVSNPDQMTDVYVGDSEGNLGFTILFFDTEYSLSEVNNEGNANMKSAGAKIVFNNSITISGQTCYKTIYEYSIESMEIKQISYTLKKGNTVYNVKFGNNKKAIDNNITLIDNIISTFKIK